MAVTQYIGARYVPVFADPVEWSSTKQYEPLTIVLHQGSSFTSKQFVPVGVDIDDTDYWAETGNYNAQVEAYRHEVQGLQSDIDNVESIIPSSDFTPSATIKDYIDSQIEENFFDDFVILNVTTGSNGSLGYALDVSTDLLNYQTVEGMSFPNFNPTDVRTYPYGNGYLIACSGVVSDIPSNDFKFCYTEDFRNMVVHDVSLGLINKRNELYPNATINDRWAPGFFEDSGGNLYAYISLRKTNNDGSTTDVFGNTRGWFGIFATKVEVVDNDLVSIGDAFEISFDDNSTFDACFFNYNNTLMCLARSGYTGDVNLYTSIAVDNFRKTKDDVFKCVLSEAPNVLEINGTWYIFGQTFSGMYHINLCVCTRNFVTFIPVGVPRTTSYKDTVCTKFMRNMNPFIMSKKAFVDKYGSVPYDIYIDPPTVPLKLSASEYANAFDPIKNGGRIHGVFYNTILELGTYKVTDNIHVCDFWNNALLITRNGKNNSSKSVPNKAISIKYYNAITNSLRFTQGLPVQATHRDFAITFTETKIVYSSECYQDIFDRQVPIQNLEGYNFNMNITLINERTAVLNGIITVNENILADNPFSYFPYGITAGQTIIPILETSTGAIKWLQVIRTLPGYYDVPVIAPYAVTLTPGTYRICLTNITTNELNNPRYVFSTN